MTTDEEIHWRPPALETDRLVLRPLRGDDAAAVFAYASSARVAEPMTWEPHRSIDDTYEFLVFAEASYGDGHLDPYAMVLRDSGLLIGTVGCRWISRPSACLELGYALGEPHWGAGYATEAAAAVVDFAFREAGAERVQARVRPDNARSRRVVEKLGMRLEGTLRHSVRKGDRWHDAWVLSVLRAEWCAADATRDELLRRGGKAR